MRDDFEVDTVRESAAELQDRLEQTTAALEAARQALGLALGTLHQTLASAAQPSAEQAEIQRLGAALDELRASEAYRVGLAITWPARHLKRLLRRS